MDEFDCCCINCVYYISHNICNIPNGGTRLTCLNGRGKYWNSSYVMHNGIQYRKVWGNSYLYFNPKRAQPKDFLSEKDMEL